MGSTAAGGVVAARIGGRMAPIGVIGNENVMERGCDGTCGGGGRQFPFMELRRSIWGCSLASGSPSLSRARVWGIVVLDSSS